MSDLRSLDHAEMDEQQVVDRYLLGQLSTAEREAFEQHYLHCQRCLDRLEEAERFQGAVKRAAAEAAAEPAGEDEPRGRILPFPARLLASPRRLGLIAAALVAALLLPPALLWRQAHQAGQELAQATRPQVNTPVFHLAAQRGGPGADGPSHIVRLGPEPEWIVLSLDLGLAEHAAYRAVLLRGGEELWQGEGLVPDAAAALTVSFHSSFLEPGDYRLRVEAATAGRGELPAAEYSFRVP